LRSFNQTKAIDLPVKPQASTTARASKISERIIHKNRAQSGAARLATGIAMISSNGSVE
jgi:hypothetical protein